MKGIVVSNFQANSKDWWQRYFLFNCPQLNAMVLKNGKSTLGQVIAWFRQDKATARAYVDPDIYPNMSSQGHNMLNLSTKCATGHKPSLWFLWQFSETCTTRDKNCEECDGGFNQWRCKKCKGTMKQSGHPRMCRESMFNKYKWAINPREDTGLCLNIKTVFAG